MSRWQWQAGELVVEGRLSLSECCDLAREINKKLDIDSVLSDHEKG